MQPCVKEILVFSLIKDLIIRKKEITIFFSKSTLWYNDSFLMGTGFKQGDKPVLGPKCMTPCIKIMVSYISDPKQALPLWFQVGIVAHMGLFHMSV